MNAARCPDDSTLRALLAGTLADDEAGAVCAHLQVCPACRDRAERLARDDSALKATLRNLLPGTTIPATPPAAAPGVAIPGYDIRRKIRGGGQGVVYLATQRNTGQKVAIKIIREENDDDPAARRKFRREIELIAQMRHPHIVRIYDSGTTPDGRLFYVMEYIQGVSLREAVQRDRPTLETVLGWCATIASAVSYAHERGVIHRDLKPSNVLVDGAGHVYLLDFGLARWLAASELSRVTVTHEVVGTLPYMAPEQARGDHTAVDGRTDVYALGVMLYEMLTGHYPYPVVGHVADVLRHIIETDPTPPTRSWTPDSGVLRRDSGAVRGCPIDADLQTIMLKALAKEAPQRYQRVEDFRRDLQRYLDGEPIEARGASPVHRWKVRMRRAVRRYPGLATVIVAVGCAGAGLFVGGRLGRWTGASQGTMRWLIRMAPVMRNTFEHVRLVVMTDDTDLAAMAARFDCAQDSALGTKMCLYAALLERLGDARPAAIACGFHLPVNRSEYAPFVEAARSLGDSGIDVVMQVASWSVDKDDFPQMSHDVARVTRWGCSTLVARHPVTIDLMVMRAAAVPMLSFALESVAAARRPGTQVEVVLDGGPFGLHLSYWRPNEALPGRKVWLPPSDFVQCSGIDERSHDAALGHEDGDRVPLLALAETAGPALDNATLEFSSAMTCDATTLRERVAGKVVLVGRMTSSESDHMTLADGTSIPKLHPQALAIETLLSSRRRAPAGQMWLLVVPCLVGMLLARIAWPTAVVVSLAAALMAIALIGGIVGLRFLLDPVPLVAAAGLSCLGLRLTTMSRSAAAG